MSSDPNYNSYYPKDKKNNNAGEDVEKRKPTLAHSGRNIN
jgi:hypothetical protein